MKRIRKKGDKFWLYDPENDYEHELLHRKSLDHVHTRILKCLGSWVDYDPFTEIEDCPTPKD